jgi:hypothetical protein
MLDEIELARILNPVPTDDEVLLALHRLSERHDELTTQLQHIESTRDMILAEFAAGTWRNGLISRPANQTVN